jgi:hypothetical protein
MQDLVVSGHTHAACNCRLPNAAGREIPVTSDESVNEPPRSGSSRSGITLSVAAPPALPVNRTVPLAASAARPTPETARPAAVSTAATTAQPPSGATQAARRKARAARRHGAERMDGIRSAHRIDGL